MRLQRFCTNHFLPLLNMPKLEEQNMWNKIVSWIIEERMKDSTAYKWDMYICTSRIRIGENRKETSSKINFTTVCILRFELKK